MCLAPLIKLPSIDQLSGTAHEQVSMTTKMHTLLLERGLQTNVKKLDINLNPRALGELLKVTFKIFYLPAANQDHLIVVD